MTLKQKLFSFHGRLGRLPFFLLTIAAVVVPIIVGCTLAVFGALLFVGTVDPQPSPTQMDYYIDIASSIMAFIIGALVTWMQAALGAKRLHDFNQNGWWQIVFYIPIVNILGLLLLLVMVFKRGDTGDNAYGLPPGAELSA